MSSGDDSGRDAKKREAFRQLEFLIDHGFEALLLSQDLHVYVPLLQATLSFVQHGLISVSIYIDSIDRLEREISEKRLHALRTTRMIKLAATDFGHLDKDVKEK